MMKTLTFLLTGILFFNLSFGQQMLEVPIVASSDDAEEEVGAIDLYDSDLDIGFSGGNYNTVGLRFLNINIPQNAQVDSVFIQFTSHEPNAPFPDLEIVGQDADDPNTFQQTSNNISNRNETTANVMWSPGGNWTMFNRMDDQRTPDLINIFNEIRSRPGWQNGNAMVFIISGTTAQEEKIETESFDQPFMSRVPALQVYYTECQLSLSNEKEDQSCPMVNDGSIDLTINGMGSNISVMWSNGETTEDIDSLAPGTYMVTVTSDACNLMDTVEIMPSDLPLSCLEDTTTMQLCEGDTALIQACQAPMGYQYAWYHEDTILTTTDTPFLEITTGGTYAVEFEGECDLGRSESIIVTFNSPAKPSVDVAEDTLTGPAGFDEYRWYFEGMLVATTDTNIYVAQENGSYTLVVVDADGCVSEESDVVEVMCQLSLSTVKEDQTCPIVNDANIDLTINGMGSNISVMWSNGETTEDIDSLSPGTYMVTVTSNTCNLVDTVEILPSDLPLSCLEDTTSMQLCEGDTAMIQACQAPMGYQYAWYHEDTLLTTTDSSFLEVTTAGNYTVAFEGECMLGRSESLFVESLPAPDQPAIDIKEDTLTGPAGFDEYRWFLEDMLVASTSTNIYVADESGSYTLVVVDANGCASEESDAVQVMISGIFNIRTANHIDLYPNPAQDFIQFILPHELAGQPFECSIFTLTGHKVLQKKMISNGKIEISHLVAGSYFTKIERGMDRYMGYFIKN